LQNVTRNTAIAGNENTGFLKLIAICSMVIDHVGAIYFPAAAGLRVIGRMAFPLYAWCLVVGAEHTRDIRRYFLRLLLVGIVSQPFFMLAFGHKWNELNIFFTLALGLLALLGIQQRQKYSQIWCPILMLLIPLIIWVDYSWQGVLLILLLYAVRKSRSALCTTLIAFCLYWGFTGTSMMSFFGIPLPIRISFMPQATTLLSVFRRIQFWALLALPLITIPMKKPSIHLPKWVAYGIYPAHLFLLWAIHFWAVG